MAMANSVDCQLKRLGMLSLKDISVRRVATILFRDPVKLAFEVTVEDEHGKRRVLSEAERYYSLVAELELPESIREHLVSIMHPIFLESYDWFTFHKQFLLLNYSELFFQGYTKHIHWTYMGIINYRKTAEAMIRDENLKIDVRFMLACLYCFEKDIQDIWEELSEPSKKDFYNNGEPCSSGCSREIIVLWICLLEGQVGKLNSLLKRMGRRYSSINQYAFETFPHLGYETATQYFFEKLTCEEKDASLVRTANTLASNIDIFYGQCTNVFCYLLSQMNAEQLQNVLENSSYGILRVFLDWPRQDALPEIAKFSLPYFKEGDYSSLHLYFCQKFKYDYHDTKLFQFLFVFVPKQYRHSAFYMKGWLEDKNTEIIRFMFKNMNSAETLALVFNHITLRACYKLAQKGEWNFLKFFICESGLSKEDRERFVVAFKSKFAWALDLEISERFTLTVTGQSSIV